MARNVYNDKYPNEVPEQIFSRIGENLVIDIQNTSSSGKFNIFIPCEYQFYYIFLLLFCFIFRAERWRRIEFGLSPSPPDMINISPLLSDRRAPSEKF